MIRLSVTFLLAATAASAESHTLDRPVSQGAPNAEFAPAFAAQTRAPALAEPGEVVAQIVAEGLDHPWGIEVLPPGDYLVTERSGALRVVGRDGQVGAPIEGVPEVMARRQGGLLDVALAEDFEASRRIYLTYSKPMGMMRSATAAATGVLSDDLAVLRDVRDIFVQEPASMVPAHFGSRIVLDGDVAYITAGEHFTDANRQLAQDLGSTYGKVVRVTLDGGVPVGNPFAGQNGAVPTVWSYGHRNPQGAAIRPSDGALWTLEHGPAGGDELNRIEAGANYGWPLVSYGQNYSGSAVGTGQSSSEGVVEPRYYWDPVIAPGGFVFYDGGMLDWDGDIVAASLNPGGIVRLTLEGDTVTGEARYLGELGRVRDVEIDRDGALILLTDYDDGEIVRVMPAD